METNTHTHTQLHTQRGQWQTGRSCCYPSSCPHLGPGRLLKTTWCLQPKRPCLVPSQEEELELQCPGNKEQLLPSAGTLLAMAAGKQHWSSGSCWTHRWPEELGRGMGKLTDPGLTVLFHSTTGTQQSGWTDMCTMALALSCRKEIRSVVVLGHSQFLPVGAGRVDRLYNSIIPSRIRLQLVFGQKRKMKTEQIQNKKRRVADCCCSFFVVI